LPEGTTGFAKENEELEKLERQVYAYKEPVRTVAGRIKVRPRLVPLPFALWRVLAAGAEFLPGPPLTRNQVALMQRVGPGEGKELALPHIPSAFFVSGDSTSKFRKL